MANVNLQVPCSCLDYTQLLKGVISQSLTLTPLLVLYLLPGQSHLPVVLSFPNAMLFRKDNCSLRCKGRLFKENLDIWIGLWQSSSTIYMDNSLFIKTLLPRSFTFHDVYFLFTYLIYSTGTLHCSTI